MASTSSNSSVQIAAPGSSSINSSTEHLPLTGSDPAANVNVSGSTRSDSAGISTPLLIGIIAASVIIVVAVLLVLRSRRRRHEPKMFSPSNTSVFQGVTTSTASENSSNALAASSASTVMTSPQPPLMQTFKLSRLSAKEVSVDHVAHAVQGLPGAEPELPPERITQVPRTTSLISGRSVFSASILLRGGLRSSLPSLPGFRGSRASRSSRANAFPSMESSASTVSIAHTGSPAPPPIESKGDAWRDLSETCWSIGPGSDSETESEQYTMPAASHAQRGALVLNRNRLSTLSDGIGDIEEGNSQRDLDVNSLDDSSRRRDRATSSLDDLSPRRERGISQFDDSSPRRVRGLSALDSRRKAHSAVDIDTNESGDSYFSVESDYYDETIKDCSAVLFDDSDSDSSSDSDDSLREEEL